jgi:hypothetical protein
MKLKPEELQENGYILLDDLNHQELVPFIQTYIRKWTKFSVVYYSFNLLISGLFGFYLFQILIQKITASQQNSPISATDWLWLYSYYLYMNISMYLLIN